MKTSLHIVVVGLFLCFASNATANPSYAPNDFAYSGRIAGPLRSGGLYRIHLAPELLARCTPACNDLRIIDPRGIEVPYVMVEDRRPGQLPRSYTLEVAGFEERPAVMIVTLRMPERHEPVSRLSLEIPEKDFRKTVRVEASRDMTAWTLLADDRIYDFSSQVDLRRTAIAFPASAQRYFRITLKDEENSAPKGSGMTLKYDGLDFRVSGLLPRKIRIDGFLAMTGALQEEQTEYDEQQLEGYHVLKDKDNNTVITFETGIPFTRIGLQLSDAYFFRRATLYGSATGKEDSYRQLAQGSLYRFLLSDLAEQRNVIEGPASGSRFYRLVIENKNNPQLDIRALRLSWVRKHLLFVALADSDSCSIHFGNSNVERPDYDLPNSLSQSNWERFPAEQAAVSNIARNASFSPSPPGDARAKREKLILVLIVCGLVAGIGVWLYRLLARADDEKASRT